MYKKIKTDEKIKWGSSNIFTEIIPVATLENNFGHRVQIICHDNSYIILLEQKDGSYRHTAWIFQEVLEILRTLPNPLTQKQEMLI
jgi:hypothetical protein